jgi:hypothetical protein
MMKASGFAHFQSASVANFSTELADIIVEKPPTAGTKHAILIHHAHGHAIEANTGAAFSMRQRHLVLGFLSVVTHNELTPEAKAEAIDWSTSLDSQVRGRGLALKQGYWSFTPNDLCDVVDFFGAEATQRLRRLKQKHNPGDAFPHAYPTLR